MADTETIERTTTALKPPKKWVIIIHNNDVTSMEFVVNLLAKVFLYDADRAAELMIEVHSNNSGVVGVYQFEIAEQKYRLAIEYINAHNEMLKLSLQEE